MELNPNQIKVLNILNRWLKYECLTETPFTLQTVADDTTQYAITHNHVTYAQQMIESILNGVELTREGRYRINEYMKLYKQINYDTTNDTPT